MPKFKFTATFTGEIDVDETDERFLEPSRNAEGDETGENEPFDPDFARAVLYEDFRDGPMELVEDYDTADIALEFLRPPRRP